MANFFSKKNIYVVILMKSLVLECFDQIC